MPDPKKLTYRSIFIFWLPLAATWIMMAVEGPYISAIIARMPEPKFNLAAYGVAFSFALIIEAPVIMMMSASTALVRSRFSYLQLRNFTFILSGAITGIMLLFNYSPVFYFVVEDLIGLPHHVAHLTHLSTMILLPWPGAIGYRRFYQGILIRFNLTRRVALGTVVRLVTMSLIAFSFYKFFRVPGTVAGASALALAVSMEALVSRWMARNCVKSLMMTEERESPMSLTYSYIVRFYYPLAITSILSLSVHPVVTFFLGQSRMALESLAVLPVVNSLIFIFRSIGLSYQEVAIALMGDRMEGYRRVRNFALWLGAALLGILSVLAFTPLSYFWYHTVSGLPTDLTQFAIIPTRIMTLMPVLTLLLSFQRAVLVNRKFTHPITFASIIEIGGITLILFVAIKYLYVVGVIAATAAYVLGRLGANLYLMKPVYAARRLG